MHTVVKRHLPSLSCYLGLFNLVSFTTGHRQRGVRAKHKGRTTKQHTLVTLTVTTHTLPTSSVTDGLCVLPPHVCDRFFFRRESDGRLRVSYEVIGKNQVAVPTHFYKVVVAETEAGQLDMEAYVMPNQAIPNETPIANFLVRTEDRSAPARTAS